jgi:hypothetical protein
MRRQQLYIASAEAKVAATSPVVTPLEETIFLSLIESLQ